MTGTRRPHPAFVVGLVLLAPACLSTSPYEDENPDCFWDGNFGETGEAPAGPVLELGELEGEAFVAWQPDEQVDTVGGPQGLQMLTPHLRLVGGASGEDEGTENCFSVYIKLIRPGDDFDTAPAEGEAANAYVFTANDGDWIAGPIWTPFDDIFVSGNYQLRATVRGEDWLSELEFDVWINVDA
jgi:hypothetical protein